MLAIVCTVQFTICIRGRMNDVRVCLVRHYLQIFIKLSFQNTRDESTQKKMVVVKNKLKKQQYNQTDSPEKKDISRFHIQ
jgi:hypothetical protein